MIYNAGNASVLSEAGKKLSLNPYLELADFKKESKIIDLDTIKNKPRIAELLTIEGAEKTVSSARIKRKKPFRGCKKRLSRFDHRFMIIQADGHSRQFLRNSLHL